VYGVIDLRNLPKTGFGLLGFMHQFVESEKFHETAETFYGDLWKLYFQKYDREEPETSFTKRLRP